MQDNGGKCQGGSVHNDFLAAVYQMWIIHATFVIWKSNLESFPLANIVNWELLTQGDGPYDLQDLIFG